MFNMQHTGHRFSADPEAENPREVYLSRKPRRCRRKRTTSAGWTWRGSYESPAPRPPLSVASRAHSGQSATAPRPVIYRPKCVIRGVGGHGSMDFLPGVRSVRYLKPVILMSGIRRRRRPIGGLLRSFTRPSGPQPDWTRQPQSNSHAKLSAGSCRCVSDPVSIAWRIG